MTISSALDHKTTDAIRQAIAAAGRGAVADACRIGERALASGGDVTALNAMLGMLRCQTGDFEAGVRHLQVAHKARLSDQKIATNLVMALHRLERFEEALAILSDDLARTDPSMGLQRLRGFMAQSVGDFPGAIRAYEAVVAKVPRDFESWNNLGNARRAGGDAEGGVEALRRAAELAPDSAPIRLNLASALIHYGDWNGAETELRKMAADFPDDPNPHRELHALMKMKNWGTDEEALEAIKAAVERAPTDISLLLGLASHLSYTLHSAGAEEVYRRVLTLDPANSLAHIGLALCFDLTNRTDELSALVAQAEERSIGPNALNFVRAYDHRRAKRYAEGLAALSQVPDELESSRRAHLMGQLLDGVGRHDEAFASYKRMNDIMAAQDPHPQERAAGYRKMLKERHSAMTQAWADSWREETEKDPRPAPVFLVGFPRSGTTLLDTMLMGHPSIEVLEEEPTLHKAFEIFADYSDIPTASDEKIRAARDAYFQKVRELTPLKDGNLLVDKNPLAMNAVPFIRRLFPDAKIILAVRHPCDVVLSCYITNFRPNDGMANFLSLDTAAELYDISFSYFERSRELLKLPVHTVIYENVVADRERELAALMNFLELGWHDALMEHEATALGRGRIKTASYSQVVEPIYTRAAGRWERYRKHLEPVLPTLQPWIDHFGYRS